MHIPVCISIRRVYMYMYILKLDDVNALCIRSQNYFINYYYDKNFT